VRNKGGGEKGLPSRRHLLVALGRGERSHLIGGRGTKKKGQHSQKIYEGGLARGGRQAERNTRRKKKTLRRYRILLRLQKKGERR